MTTLAQEREKHQRWLARRRPRWQPLFDALLTNEFRSEDAQRAWQGRALTRMLRFAVSEVPYYTRLFDERGLSPTEIRTPDDLRQLPVLRKVDVIAHGVQLRARALPSGERAAGATRSSGTTGRPVTVLQSGGSSTMFSILWHRQARWFDLKPEGTLVDVRIAGEIGGGQPNPDGSIVRRPRWRYLGQFCETGPEYGFNSSNPMDQQVEWLRQYRPHYAMTAPGALEEWLLASSGRKPVESLKVLIGVGSQLTPALRRRLEETYDIPIHQTYGLNEIGKVALRCEAGRYHVHTEHCLVEVVHPGGEPCAPGQTGQLLVTGFRNHAMPLIRYDTGDLAEAAGGPCACGRTLPSFREVAGRYRRFAGLPGGTRKRVYALLGAFDTIPWDALAFLRRYQIHQDRDNGFTLRVQTVGPIPEVFRQHIQRAWAAVAGEPPCALAIVAVNAIAPSPSGKLLDFVSDFYADAFAASSMESPASPESTGSDAPTRAS